ITIADRSFAVGDRVMTLRNDRRRGVLNGEQGIVTGIDPHTQTVTVRTNAQHDIVLPPPYLLAGNLAHAYAMTIHKAQGMTCDIALALALADDTLYREAAYTALSRGRHENRLYLVTDQAAREERHAPEYDDRARDELVRQVLERSL